MSHGTDTKAQHRGGAERGMTAAADRRRYLAPLLQCFLVVIFVAVPLVENYRLLFNERLLPFEPSFVDRPVLQSKQVGSLPASALSFAASDDTDNHQRDEVTETETHAKAQIETRADAQAQPIPVVASESITHHLNATVSDKVQNHDNGGIALNDQGNEPVVGRDGVPPSATVKQAHTFPDGLTSKGQSRIGLFYNVYWNPNTTDLSYAIIQEQLQQRMGMEVQYVDTNTKSHNEDVVVLEQKNHTNDKDGMLKYGAPEAHLYYFTLGKPGQQMPPCEPCHHLGHRDEGFEQYTLQAMYEYCRIRPQDTVVYMHNKGSFTDSPMNHRLRRHLTKAVMSEACLRMPRAFNFCSALFTGFPFAQVTGNFYTVRCSYVQKLIPPNDFEDAMTMVYSNMMKNTSLSWVNDPDPKMTRESWIGLGRYALEHWIGSHPSLHPLSVYPLSHGAFRYRWVPKDLSWKPTYRKKIFKAHHNQKNVPKFYKLAGRLYLYEKLYGELPPKSSWIWKFYFV